MWNEFKRQVFGSKPKPKQKSSDYSKKLKRDRDRAVSKNKKTVAKVKKQFGL